jgi:GTP cyclohydrolase I
MQDSIRILMERMGENHDREGLEETPIRFLKAWNAELLIEYQKSYKPNLKFELGLFDW